MPFLSGGNIDIEHDTSIRAIIPYSETSHIVMSGLPGLEIARDGSSYLHPELCELSFEALSEKRVEVVYMLMEKHELPEQSQEIIGRYAKRFEIKLEWMPIRDFDIPKPAFTKKWKNTCAYRRDILSGGGSICVACLYGAGRSGMIAAAIFSELGMACDEAISFVRKEYRVAIGNAKQEDWIKRAAFLHQ